MSPVNAYLLLTLLCACVGGIIYPRLGFAMLLSFLIFDLLSGRYPIMPA